MPAPCLSCRHLPQGRPHPLHLQVSTAPTQAALREATRLHCSATIYWRQETVQQPAQAPQQGLASWSVCAAACYQVPASTPRLPCRVAAVGSNWIEFERSIPYDIRLKWRVRSGTHLLLVVQRDGSSAESVWRLHTALWGQSFLRTSCFPHAAGQLLLGHHKYPPSRSSAPLHRPARSPSSTWRPPQCNTAASRASLSSSPGVSKGGQGLQGALPGGLPGGHVPRQRLTSQLCPCQGDHPLKPCNLPRPAWQAPTLPIWMSRATMHLVSTAASTAGCAT